MHKGTFRIGNLKNIVPFNDTLSSFVIVKSRSVNSALTRFLLKKMNISTIKQALAKSTNYKKVDTIATRSLWPEGVFTIGNLRKWLLLMTFNYYV